MAETQRWQALPTQLERAEFEQFVNDNDLSPRSPFGVELPNLATMQRVPAIMNLNLLPDMGRMAPQ